MRRIALTGGIATGKSYVARRLAGAGVPVVDADVLAREAVAPGTAGLEAIRARFGDRVIGPDGGLDRQALAAIVFADAGARRDLEAIVHPVVRAAIDRFFEALPPDTPVAVADIPLLFETGREAEFDAVVVAACPARMQRERVMQRDGATWDEASRRIAAQMPIDEKMRRADHVIRTDGSYADTDRQVDRVLARLRDTAPA
ncbi:MAG: dephospho-CoA kinase [Vicinamibacterales bacterium]